MLLSFGESDLEKSCFVAIPCSVIPLTLTRHKPLPSLLWVQGPTCFCVKLFVSLHTSTKKTNSSSAKMTTIMPSETDVKNPQNESTLRINCHWNLKISYNYLTTLHPQPYHKIICPGHITQCPKFLCTWSRFCQPPRAVTVMEIFQHAHELNK